MSNKIIAFINQERALLEADDVKLLADKQFVGSARTSHALALEMLEIAMEELNSNYLNVKNCSCCSVKAGKLKEAIARIEKLLEKKA